MGLEAATYIGDLVISNPTGLDEVNKGDDHLRLIKSVLQNTFPNANAAINVTPTEANLLVGLTADAAELNILDGAVVTTAEVNFLSGVTSGIQAQLDAITTLINGLFPIGHILYSRSAADPGTYGYPGTWAQMGQGRVLVGEGSGAGLTTRVAGTQFGVEDAVLPSHTHSITQNNHSHGLRGGGNDDDGGPRPPGGDNNANMQGTQGAQANITINSSGVSATDQNMQPSEVVYIWERTA